MPDMPFEALPGVLIEYERRMKRAAMNAINRTAYMARQSLLKELGEKFTLRNRWANASTRYEKATMDKQEAVVFTVSRELAGQEKGETRSSAHDYRVPVAVREVFGIPNNKVIPKAYRAPSLLAKGKVKGMRVYRGQSASGKPGIYAQPVGGGRTRLLWALDPSLTIKKKPWFFHPIDRVVDQNLTSIFNEEVGKELDDLVLSKLP